MVSQANRKDVSEVEIRENSKLPPATQRARLGQEDLVRLPQDRCRSARASQGPFRKKRVRESRSLIATSHIN